MNVSEAARDGLREGIRCRRAERDREAYLAQPETEDAGWEDPEFVRGGDGNRTRE